MFGTKRERSLFPFDFLFWLETFNDWCCDWSFVSACRNAGMNVLFTFYEFMHFNCLLVYRSSVVNPCLTALRKYSYPFA
jgi:hypothetical protein